MRDKCSGQSRHIRGPTNVGQQAAVFSFPDSKDKNPFQQPTRGAASVQAVATSYGTVQTVGGL